VFSTGWMVSYRLLALGIGLLAGYKACAQYVLPSDAGTMVNGFQDSFSGSALGANWVVCGANDFYVSGGALHVTTAGGNPSHLLYELPGYNQTVQEVLARIRVLNSQHGDGWSMADATGKDQGLAIYNLTFSASARPALSVQVAGANLILSWPYGQLQSSTNVAGPYSTLTGVASPFTNSLEGPCQFYRIVAP